MGIELCPCCSGKKYVDCCEPFHKGFAVPDDALALMRSRYSAYALHNPDYIMATTHPQNSGFKEDLKHWRDDILLFTTNTLFEQLEIIEFKSGSNQAEVTFKAYLAEGDQDVSFEETSIFEKVDGRWLYKAGTLVNKR